MLRKLMRPFLGSVIALLVLGFSQDVYKRQVPAIPFRRVPLVVRPAYNLLWSILLPSCHSRPLSYQFLSPLLVQKSPGTKRPASQLRLDCVLETGVHSAL